MIIMRITGGLGNQLFQYATGRTLSEKFNTTLKLDITEVLTKKYRKFLLDRFRIKAQTASPEVVKKFWRFSVHNLFRSPEYKVFKEKHFHYDHEFEKIKDNTYIVGFFQSDKYFNNIKQLIKREFSLKNGLSTESKKIAAKIKSVNAVSINVRRGDYVSDPIIHKRHGFIGVDYFLKAINYIKKNTSNPHFFLFSDDIQWVKENLHIPHQSTYVDLNFPDHVEENLILGSLCNHNIITNSTFSWWVGWLNANKKKIVVAPKKWFKDLDVSTKDLFPKSWILL